MSQHHSPTTALLETSRALVEAQRELIPLLKKRIELSEQLHELEGAILLAKVKVDALKEAREVLGDYVDGDKDFEDYASLEVEACRDARGY